METYETVLTPEECRARLARALASPPTMRFRFSGQRQIVGRAHDDGSVTIWDLPSGPYSPTHVTDVRFFETKTGSHVVVAHRVAWSRLWVWLAVGLVLAIVTLMLILVAPATPARSAGSELDVLMPPLLIAVIALCAAATTLFVRRQGPQDIRRVEARLRELLALR